MTEIKGYHAHVYYNADTRKIAEGLRDTIIEKFAVKPGAFSDEPIGPHPISQFNVIFQSEEFQKIVPWLMLNHEGLDVLIHPLTESSYDDHSKNALWIGTPVPMRLDILRPAYRPELLPTNSAAVNRCDTTLSFDPPGAEGSDAPASPSGEGCLSGQSGSAARCLPATRYNASGSTP